ncbi:ethylene-responsive transcription factor [Tripterygium wilfordii]|uniref:Ethylene-responsive transcription factor n=1 Tax=Tripterygium wilfordii TaxID=458696 RepID=A0A7J7CAC8_TRIWF|nr:ethylene-responsive transcription factor ERF027-like [Tripterygium wilfordii]KAF5731124.1 ethylene-responsive transcription factor [Tripterygium wilfordii]
MTSNPHQNMPQTDKPPNPCPSIQLPDPPPEVQSPHCTSSNPSRRPVQSPGGSSAIHTKYRGVRSQSGKWVSEIREPRKTTRIWLGTYPTPEMAAAAHDVAALALKGPDTPLNFSDSILTSPVPASTSANDIRAAAASAAASRSPKADQNPGQGTTSSSSGIASTGQEFIDEEALLNVPKLLVDMAEGMLLSPPRINTDSSGNLEGESLWSYPEPDPYEREEQ